MSEGSKTEPNYFEEIRQQNSIPTLHVKVLPSSYGTQPRQVVNCAEDIATKTKAYERVYAVFDRDDHSTYHDALNRSAALNGKLRNDNGSPVYFAAIPSVACFELWLLLHYEEVCTFQDRKITVERLKCYLPDYAKGSTGIYKLTEPNLSTAVQRAQWLRQHFHAHTGTDPFTSVDEVVELLRSMRK